MSDRYGVGASDGRDDVLSRADLADWQYNYVLLETGG